MDNDESISDELSQQKVFAVRADKLKAELKYLANDAVGQMSGTSPMAKHYSFYAGFLMAICVLERYVDQNAFELC